jgi:hypothetical protein
MDRSWLTGKTSADHLRHTRPEYYETLVKQTDQQADANPVGESSGDQNASVEIPPPDLQKDSPPSS